MPPAPAAGDEEWDFLTVRGIRLTKAGHQDTFFIAQVQYRKEEEEGIRDRQGAERSCLQEDAEQDQVIAEEHRMPAEPVAAFADQAFRRSKWAGRAVAKPLQVPGGTDDEPQTDDEAGRAEDEPGNGKPQMRQSQDMIERQTWREDQ